MSTFFLSLFFSLTAFREMTFHELCYVLAALHSRFFTELTLNELNYEMQRRRFKCNFN